MRQLVKHNKEQCTMKNSAQHIKHDKTIKYKCIVTCQHRHRHLSTQNKTVQAMAMRLQPTCKFSFQFIHYSYLIQTQETTECDIQNCILSRTPLQTLGARDDIIIIENTAFLCMVCPLSGGSSAYIVASTSRVRTVRNCKVNYTHA